MIEKCFFEKFELIADAPDAVAKMRQSILTLAVQGKLVPQHPNDEPAEELIDRVSAALPNKQSENPFLGEIKASITDESEYDLPYGWAWLPLGHVGIWATGCGFPTQYQGESDKEFLFCKVSDMNLPGNEVEINATVHTVDAEVMKTIRARANPAGTVIFPKIGGAIATHKRRLVIKPTIIDNNCSGIQPIGLTYDRWLLLLMRNLDLTKYQSGTSVPAVSQGALDPIRIGLPPFAQQKRIVAKVDELMALCDQLEAQQQERETRKSTLVRASLARFAEAPTPANLELLFHKSYDIPPAELRKSILTLAVQGKLVPQNPNDEPAETLCQPDEELAAASSFELPNGWIWTRLLKLSEINGGFAFKSTAYTEEGTRVVRISDFDEFGFKDHKVVRYPFSAELQKYALEEQNILLAMTGGTVGKSYFVRSMPEPMVVNQRVATIKVSDSALPSYIDIVIRSEMTQEVIRKAKNSTNDNISMGDIKGFTIPLPPLAEQHRIVAKVEQVMTLVDELESQLDSTRVTGSKLLEAIVHQLTNGGANHAIEV